MSNAHLTDTELQQYLFEGKEKNSFGSHLKSCETCRLRAENYVVIFKEIKKQPAPSFDFSVSELILAGLPAQKASRTADRLIWLLIAIGTLIVLIPGYLILSVAVSAIPSIAIWLIVIASVAIFLFHLTGPINEYTGKMRILNSI